MHEFSFGSVSSADYGAYVLDVKVRTHTRRSMEFLPIDGRSGDLLLDNGRYENIEVVVTCAITSNVERLFSLHARLLSEVDYNRLSSTFDREHYWIGAFAGGITPRISYRGDLAVVELPFNCKPQRFLTVGDVDVLVIDSPTSTQITPTRAMVSELNDNSRSVLGFLGVFHDYETAVFDLTGFVGGTNILKLIYSKDYNVRLRVNGIIRTDLVPWLRDSESPLTTPSSVMPAANATKLLDDYTITIPLSNYNPWYAVPMPIQGYVIDTDGDIMAALLPTHGIAHYPAEVAGGSPLLKIDVTGALDVSPAVNIADKVTIDLNTPSSIDGVSITEICIDLDTYNAYFQKNGATHNLNRYVGIKGDMMYKGDIDVSIDNRIDALHYIPRWWTL